MSKNILLARPHPFIVSEMKPFLESAGYGVSKLEDSQQIGDRAKNSVGSVISLAVSSSVPESAEDIFAQLRHAAPSLPVLFAAMSPLSTLRASLERLAKMAGVHAIILGIDAANATSTALGHPDTFLYFSKDDLVDERKKAIALTMLKRHFR